MSAFVRARLMVSAFAGIVVAAMIVVILPSGPAAAHGNVVGPASRNYGCYERWGSKFQAPEMATQDPMCYQAWQANPNAMWNWNGLFREGVAGNHQAAIPDGQLCSAGHTQGGRYNAMDAVGAWKPTTIATTFNVRLFDGALHGADYIRVYVTRPGFNPVTSALKWSDLELVSQIGNTPAARWTPVSGGVQIDLPVAVPGRTGRAMVYTIWQASHLDQSYYFCSDISFGGETPTPPTTPPTTTPPGPSAGCTATYALSSQWQGGYQAEVTVTAGTTAIRSWRVALTHASAQSVSQSWNASVTASGNAVTATNAAYNGTLTAGARTTFGFIGSGSPDTPTLTCTATT